MFEYCATLATFQELARQIIASITMKASTTEPNELMGEISMNGWTEERRQKQSEAIRRWKPWEQSTGPKSEQGKRAASRNSLKHGRWSSDQIEVRRSMLEMVRRLREQFR